MIMGKAEEGEWRGGGGGRGGGGEGGGGGVEKIDAKSASDKTCSVILGREIVPCVPTCV